MYKSRNINFSGHSKYKHKLKKLEMLKFLWVAIMLIFSSTSGKYLPEMKRFNVAGTEHSQPVFFDNGIRSLVRRDFVRSSGPHMNPDYTKKFFNFGYFELE